LGDPLAEVVFGDTVSILKAQSSSLTTGRCVHSLF
jgi:hypothetical protein